MAQQQSAGAETVNSFLTPRGVQRTLQVELKEDGVDIDFTLKSSNSGQEIEYFKSIELNYREAKALFFYLLRKLFSDKFLANKYNKTH